VSKVNFRELINESCKLPNLQFDLAKEEIKKSKQILEHIIGKKVTSFLTHETR
jgi:uncharacterized protein YbcI